MQRRGATAAESAIRMEDPRVPGSTSAMAGTGHERAGGLKLLEVVLWQEVGALNNLFRKTQGQSTGRQPLRIRLH